MRLLPLLFGASVFLCVAPGVEATHLGADRQLDRFSPFIRALYDRPPPQDLQDLYVLVAVLHHAHDNDGAASLARYAERTALLELLGEPAPPPPARLELAIQEMASEAKTVGALRLRVLQVPVDAEVLQAHVPELAPKIHGWSFRHDGGSVWTRDDGGTQRLVGVRIVNRGARDLLGGTFTLELAPDPKVVRFECSYNMGLAAGSSMLQLCSGDGTKPVEGVFQVLREMAARARAPTLAHREVVYELHGARFEVRPYEANLRDPSGAFGQRALSMIEEQSCGARRACGAAVAEGMQARPMLAGFAIGFIAGWLVLLVAWIAGTRVAATVGVGMLGVVGALLIAIVVAAVVTVSGGHILLIALIAGVAAGYAGDAAVGFTVGAAASFVVAVGLGQLRLALRT